MTKHEFIKACKFLFGFRWKEEAARVFGISARSVHRYAKGEREVPDYLIVLIINACKRKHVIAASIEEKLRKKLLDKV